MTFSPFGRVALTAFFCLFVLFLYGPTLTIVVRAPVRASGRRRFRRRPSTLVAAGSYCDGYDGRGIARRRTRFPPPLHRQRPIVHADHRQPDHSLCIGLLFNLTDLDPAWYSSAFGARLTWTLPFGLLIMFAVFNRFNRAWEEAARDLGASPEQRFRYVVLPIIAPSVVGVALFGFTLSYDEFARALLTAGSDNTLPLEIFGMTTNVTTPVLYALGTVTTGLSFLVIGAALATVAVFRRVRRA